MPFRWFDFVACLLAFMTMSLSSLADGASSFHHRQYHRSIVVGNYLYIDGGEIVTWNHSGNGVQAGYGVQGKSCFNQTCLGNITVLPDNNTYSIDLSQSWTSATAALNPIAKPQAAVLNQQALWLDVSGTSFYAYDGGSSWAFPPPRPVPPANTLWKFAPSGNGGQWSQVYPSAQSIYNSLVRTLEGAFASGNGLGFVLGGLTSGQTISMSKSVNGYPPGLVVFNSSSQTWSNVSSLDYSSGGTSHGSGAHFVSSFGPQGLLSILGGSIYSPGSNNEIQVDPSIVHLYEPQSQQWKSQATTGTSPPSMQVPCVVGAQGDNGTYEIFVYGGWSSDSINSTIQLGNVYVLSLPAFHWFTTNQTLQYGRYHHACSAHNRYMIATGGQVAPYADYEANQDNIFISVADPWAQGLGVFDMVDLVWTNRYDASASAYTTPQSIKDYYAANPRYPPSLTSDGVLSSWFAANTTASATPSPTPSTSNQAQAPSKSNTKAIVGGVVGGILGVLAIGFVIWWFYYKKSKSKSKPTRQPNTYADNVDLDQKQELASPLGGGKHEMGVNRASSHPRHAELTGETKSRQQEVYEM